MPKTSEMRSIKLHVAIILAIATVVALACTEPVAPSDVAVVHGASAWNAGGFTGAGVKVGIIDVGFIGGSALIGTELPSTAVARCYTAIGVFSSNLADCETRDKHGTAVAEAVVDMAPNVTLYIANPQSGGDLKATASWMVSQGVKIMGKVAF